MKFLRKFYRWSLILLIPLLMGSYIRGCSLLSWFGVYIIFCQPFGNYVWNDETYYDLGGPEGEQYILISDLGKIWHGYLQDGCLQDLFEDTQNQTNNLLYRIEYFEEFYLMIVVGENGTILREDNPSVVNDWDLINSPTNNNLKGLCKSGNSIFAAGDAGTVIKSDDEGVTWELLTFPYNVNLNDCSSPAAGEVI